MRSLLSFLLLGCLLSVGLIAEAEPFGEGRGTGPGAILRELDLSPEQIEQLRSDTPGAGRELRQKMEEERAELNSMLRDRSSSEKQILSQQKKIEQTFSEWNSFRLKRMLKAREVLSEEQFKKMLEIRQERGAGAQHSGEGPRRWFQRRGQGQQRE